MEKKMGKVEQDKNGWACWRCLGRVAIQVTGAGLEEKVTLEQIRKAVRGSVVQLSGKSTQGEGTASSQVLGWARVHGIQRTVRRPVWLEQSGKRSVGGQGMEGTGPQYGRLCWPLGGFGFYSECDGDHRSDILCRCGEQGCRWGAQ